MFRSPFYAKVFIWRLMVGGLSIRSVLSKRGLGSGTCFFCTILLEDSIHRFINRPTVHIIWKYLIEIWQVLSHCYLRPQQWVFAQDVQNDPNVELEILFQFFTTLWTLTQLEYA